MEIFGISIYIVIAAFVALIVLVLIMVKLKNRNKDIEEFASILDVNEVGVNETKDFSYGYQKEETIVMNPVNEENKEEKEDNNG